MSRTIEIAPAHPLGFGDGKLQAFAEGIWTATTPVRFAGTWFPHVMTVMRLAAGELVLHSPCQPSTELVGEIAKVGNVAHIVAPNWFHDLYLKEYRTLYPEARLWGPAFLRWQHRSLVDAVLNDVARPPWFAEMPHISVTGLLTFDECLFFHQATRTLIVADLLMNVTPDSGLPALTRLGYRFLALDGSVRVFPVLRWFGIAERVSLRRAVRQVFDWDPQRLIVAHGTPIQESVPDALRAAFAWLRD